MASLTAGVLGNECTAPEILVPSMVFETARHALRQFISKPRWHRNWTLRTIIWSAIRILKVPDAIQESIVGVRPKNDCICFLP